MAAEAVQRTVAMERADLVLVSIVVASLGLSIRPAKLTGACNVSFPSQRRRAYLLHHIFMNKKSTARLTAPRRKIAKNADQFAAGRLFKTSHHAGAIAARPHPFGCSLLCCSPLLCRWSPIA